MPVFVGTSGWNYPHWKGRFYPREVKEKDWFGYYARYFRTVEINNTFYQLPSEKTFISWEKQAPEDFLFTVKANRFITHVKKLKDPEQPLNNFTARAKMLREHLGPILYQFPPKWNVNRDRLERFLSLLPKNLVHVFEFRNPSWHCGEVYALLERYAVSFCAHDMPGCECPRLGIGPVAYVRFHGTTGVYEGMYPRRVLRDWAGWVEGEVRKGRKVFIYFNNDAEAQAVRDARRFVELTGSRRLDTSAPVVNAPKP